MSRSRRALALGVALLAAVGLAACSSSPTSSNLNVSAASSLTGAFTEIGKAFEAAHPGVTIAFNFGGSSTLADQIVQGAPVDVFASASSSTMQTVVDERLAADPTTFASNTLEIVTPPGNPARITGVADLAKPGVKVVVCQVAVPCGSASAELLSAAGVTLTPVSLEPDVKSVLGKVAAGEADAGIVYVTDVLAAGDSVTGVVIPADQNISTVYPIAPITGSPNSSAQVFVDYVLSSDGQAILAKYGFGKG